MILFVCIVNMTTAVSYTQHTVSDKTTAYVSIINIFLAIPKPTSVLLKHRMLLTHNSL